MLHPEAELQQRSPPSLISLAGGAPNPTTFPFLSASIQVKNGPPVTFNEATMRRALQYSASSGCVLLHGAPWCSLRRLETHGHYVFTYL